jgi:YQGE family putative transporter
MEKKMSNYKVLFGLRVLKSIISSFVDIFLVLYFLNISDSNILPLGIYKLVAVITIYLVIFLNRNFAKSKHRANLMRIGIIFDFVYFTTIILLKDKVVDYIYLIGLLYGLEEGFYYSVYNMLESDGISNEERPKFTGSYTATKSILSIIFPLIFGSLIYATGFLKALAIVFVIVVIRIILSFIFKDKNIPNTNKTNMKEFFKLTKNSKKFKQMYLIEFFNGLTYSEGAFSYIVTIYIIKVFSNSFSLGVFTSIFSVITCIIGILFAKIIKKEHYATMIKVSMTFTIISLFIMIFNCNFVTIVLFNLFQTISKSLMDLINGNSQGNLCNDERIRKEYKVEYWLTNETALCIARIISNSIFILMAYTNSQLIIIIFAVFLILYASNSIKLQRIIKEEI